MNETGLYQPTYLGCSCVRRPLPRPIPAEVSPIGGGSSAAGWEFVGKRGKFPFYIAVGAS